MWAAFVFQLSQPARLSAQEAPAVAAVAEDGAVTVGEIIIEGLKSRTPEQIKNGLSTKEGEAYNALLLREDVTRLGEIMQMVGYSVEPRDDKSVRVRFTVVEFPRLREMKAVGNNQLKSERLDKIANLKPGDVLDGNTIKSLQKALLDEYRTLGLASARVDVSILPVEGTAEGVASEADLQIIIQEGDEIIVDDLDIEGNEVFTTIRLKALLQTKGSWLFLKNHYDDRAFDDDLVTLRNLYHQHGYFDASVERGEFREGTKRGKRTLTPVIRISEGGTYTLKSVDVRGARLFSRAEIIAPFEDLIGSEYDKHVSAALDEVRGLYMDGGFLTTEIKPEYDFDRDVRGVNLLIRVVEKDRIYVGDVKVQRPKYDAEENPSWFRRNYDKIAPPISDDAIIREIMLKPGEVYSKQRERETMRRLDRLGIFTGDDGKPGISISGQPTANPRVHDVLVDVEEGVTGNLGGGVGFGDVAGLFGFVWINERNLFGDARDLRAQLQIGTGASNFSISYLDRHFRDTDDQLQTALFFNTIRRSGYNERNIGASAEITHPLYNGWDRMIRGRVQGVSLSEHSGVNADEDLNDSYPVLAARLAFRNDTRYPHQMPREGRMLFGGVEAGIAGGPLLKFMGEAEYVHEVRRNLIYKFNPSAALMPLDAGSVGLTERLFMGGSEDLRGFKVHGAGLRDDDEDEVGIGGSAKILVRNELFFPIYEPVWGVYFIDAGILGRSPVSYEMPRLSTGLGARVNLNHATLALDLAMPLLKGDGDQTQFLHFSFKSSF